MSGSYRKSFPNVWECSGAHPGYQGVIGRPSRMSGSGREAIWDIRE